MTYDTPTLSRLAFIRGPDRAELIALGRDLETETDLAKWRRLGKPYVESALALARRLVASGETIEDAAELAGYPVSALRSSLAQRPL